MINLRAELSKDLLESAGLADTATSRFGDQAVEAITTLLPSARVKLEAHGSFVTISVSEADLVRALIQCGRAAALKAG